MVHALADHARLCSSDDNLTKARLPSLSARTEWTRKPPKVPRRSRLRLRAPPASSLSSPARKMTFAVARGVFALSRAAAPPSLVSSQSTPQGGIRAVEEDFLNYDHCDYLEQDLERSTFKGKTASSSLQLRPTARRGRACALQVRRIVHEKLTSGLCESALAPARRLSREPFRRSPGASRTTLPERNFAGSSS